MAEEKSVASGIARSQFYDLFKEIQNEIKDKVNSKFLYAIEQQAKPTSEKKNTLLKNQLTYILKRILLNKNDYYISAVKTNKLNNLNSSINYNRSMIIKDNNRRSNSIMRPLKSCGNYRTINDNFNPDKIQSRYKESNNLVNIHGADNNSNNNVDSKISGYLNSLYRHNFFNSNKAGNDYFLNKNQTLYDELFQNKNGSYYINSKNDMELYGSNTKGKKKR